MRERRTGLGIVGYSLLALLVAGGLVFCLNLVGLLPWTRVNSVASDVDIQSGRLRHTRYLFGMAVRESVEDSALTRVLRPEDTAGRSPAWRRVLTRSPGQSHSPHHAFHGALSQIGNLELIWRLGRFTPEARRASAFRLLEVWRQSGSDSAAKAYLGALERLALADEGGTQAIDHSALPSSSEAPTTAADGR